MRLLWQWKNSLINVQEIIGVLVRERKMSEIEQKWSPGVSLEQADAFIKNLAIPVVGEEVTTEWVRLYKFNEC